MDEKSSDGLNGWERMGGYFVRCPDEIFADTHIPSQSKCLWMTIDRHCHNENGSWRISLERLAKLMGVTERTIQRWLKKLKPRHMHQDGDGSDGRSAVFTPLVAWERGKVYWDRKYAESMAKNGTTANTANGSNATPANPETPDKNVTPPQTDMSSPHDKHVVPPHDTDVAHYQSTPNQKNDTQMCVNQTSEHTPSSFSENEFEEFEEQMERLRDEADEIEADTETWEAHVVHCRGYYDKTATVFHKYARQMLLIREQLDACLDHIELKRLRINSLAAYFRIWIRKRHKLWWDDYQKNPDDFDLECYDYED